MQNIKLQVKTNQSINKGESLYNLPLILHNTILNWETEQRVNGNKFYQGYEELAALLNLHPQTLRHYTNVSNPKYPPVNIITNDFTAWNYLNEGMQK